jgi:hypothetical protein
MGLEIESESGIEIAEAYWLPNVSETRANARLVAAAPELLETLEEVRGFLETPSFQSAVGALPKIRSAIAKARGET